MSGQLNQMQGPQNYQGYYSRRPGMAPGMQGGGSMPQGPADQMPGPSGAIAGKGGLPLAYAQSMGAPATQAGMGAAFMPGGANNPTQDQMSAYQQRMAQLLGNQSLQATPQAVYDAQGGYANPRSGGGYFGGDGNYYRGR